MEMEANNTPTRETATPEQLASGEYEVDGVMGGQGHSPEKLIADTEACCFGFAIMLVLMGVFGIAALVQKIF